MSHAQRNNNRANAMRLAQNIASGFDRTTWADLRSHLQAMEDRLAQAEYDKRQLSQSLAEAARRVSAGTAVLPKWKPVPPRSCIAPTHEAADAFWEYWKANGETHKHGYYESTWGAINAALAHGHQPPAVPQEVQPGYEVVPVEPGFIKPDTDTHVYFYEQDFYVLSNFSAFTLQWRGSHFDTSEAAYHAEKFSFPGSTLTAQSVCAQIKLAPSAHEAYKIAERNKQCRRPDWDDVKVGIMRDILRAKVQQHEYVRRKLLDTGDRVLVEDSWRDDFWGWGPNRDGQNMLGKLWMEVREELKRAERIRAIKAEGPVAAAPATRSPE